MVLDSNFKEFIELLNVHQVKYLVIGGYAVNFHGYPRYTKDIDFWIFLHPDNVQNLLKAIQAFGFGSLGLQESDFLQPDNIIQLGYEPYRIDILMDLEGSSFDTCFANKIVFQHEQTNINFLSIEDLISIKQQAGRLQDLADAEKLTKILEKKYKRKN